MVVGQQQTAHIVVRRHETTLEEFVFPALPDIVSGSTSMRLTATAGNLKWHFFHRDAAVFHALLQKSDISNLRAQAFASDPGGIHAATVFWVDAQRANLKFDFEGLAVIVTFAIFDPPCHAVHSQAVLLVGGHGGHFLRSHSWKSATALAGKARLRSKSLVKQNFGANKKNRKVSVTNITNYYYYYYYY